jgi:hypothetical protein
VRNVGQLQIERCLLFESWHGPPFPDGMLRTVRLPRVLMLIVECRFLAARTLAFGSLLPKESRHRRRGQEDNLKVSQVIVLQVQVQVQLSSQSSRKVPVEMDGRCRNTWQSTNDTKRPVVIS